MAASKVTFTLDGGTLRRLEDAAMRLSLPKSRIVRDAILEFYDRIGRLSDRERLAMLNKFDELVPLIPARSQADVNREIREVRRARTAGGRRGDSRRPK